MIYEQFYGEKQHFSPITRNTISAVPSKKSLWAYTDMEGPDQPGFDTTEYMNGEQRPV